MGTAWKASIPTIIYSTATRPTVGHRPTLPVEVGSVFGFTSQNEYSELRLNKVTEVPPIFGLIWLPGEPAIDSNSGSFSADPWQVGSGQFKPLASHGKQGRVYARVPPNG